ncbi:MAG: glycoside hydrolase [Zoogloea sp.]|nr:glycoside hydrolase [Zoogloea sp.]
MSFIQKTCLGLLLALTLSSAALAAEEPSSVAPGEPAQTSLFDRYTGSVRGLVDKGMSFLGIRYRFGGNSPETGFDCSGFVRRVFGDALGFGLPRTASEMAQMGQRINRDDLKPGDLVFFNTMRRTFSHVGIYLGNDRFLHAPASGGGVRVEDMNLAYWANRYNGARRLLPESLQDGQPQ